MTPVNFGLIFFVCVRGVCNQNIGAANEVCYCFFVVGIKELAVIKIEFLVRDIAD